MIVLYFSLYLMKRFFIVSVLTLGLVACGVDTTGLSKDSSRTPAGNPDAAITVVEYADLQCPACRTANQTIVQPLVKQYGSEIRYEFRHFPLRTIHQYTMDLAETAECAADQGKFWEYLDTAFEKQPELTKSSVRQWAADLGLDMPLLDRCVKSHIKRDEILADYQKGLDEGVEGTPTFFVNGKKVNSNLDAITAAIEEAKSGAGQRL